MTIVCTLPNPCCKCDECRRAKHAAYKRQKRARIKAIREQYSKPKEKAPPTSKVCTKCKTRKPLEDFYKDVRNSDGITAQCKKCHRKVRCCSVCKKTKPASAFPKPTKTKKRYTECRECHAAKARAYKQKQQIADRQAGKVGNFHAQFAALKQTFLETFVLTAIYWFDGKSQEYKDDNQTAYKDFDELAVSLWQSLCSSKTNVRLQKKELPTALRMEALTIYNDIRKEYL